MCLFGHSLSFDEGEKHVNTIPRKSRDNPAKLLFMCCVFFGGFFTPKYSRGGVHLQNMLRDGIMLDPFTGTCLNRKALRSIAQLVGWMDEPVGGGVNESEHDGPFIGNGKSVTPWPSTYYHCQPMRRGVR